MTNKNSVLLLLAVLQYFYKWYFIIVFLTSLCLSCHHLFSPHTSPLFPTAEGKIPLKLQRRI